MFNHLGPFTHSSLPPSAQAVEEAFVPVIKLAFDGIEVKTFFPSASLVLSDSPGWVRI